MPQKKKVNNSRTDPNLKKTHDHPFFKVKRTLGQKAADSFTRWVGSWTFIIFTMIFIFIWMGINSAWLLFGRSWDPYPFIVLNLVLSTLAAFQAPIILMSQNRQSERDRIRAEYDYAVNRKAAREIKVIDKQLDRIERKIDSFKVPRYKS
jgi:uncharacterized membrane protein